MTVYRIAVDGVVRSGEFESLEKATAHCQRFGFLTPRADVSIEADGVCLGVWNWNGDEFVYEESA